MKQVPLSFGRDREFLCYGAFNRNCALSEDFVSTVNSMQFSIQMRVRRLSQCITATSAYLALLTHLIIANPRLFCESDSQRVADGAQRFEMIKPGLLTLWRKATQREISN
jgi:hypothetical protein